MQQLKYLTILFILAVLLVSAGGVLASPGAVAPDLGSAATLWAWPMRRSPIRCGRLRWECGYYPQVLRSLAFLRDRFATEQSHRGRGRRSGDE